MTMLVIVAGRYDCGAPPFLLATPKSIVLLPDRAFIARMYCVPGLSDEVTSSGNAASASLPEPAPDPPPQRTIVTTPAPLLLLPTATPSISLVGAAAQVWPVGIAFTSTLPTGTANGTVASPYSRP